MNNWQRDRLVEWIIDARRAGALGNGSLADVCERAAKAVGFAVDVMDYIAARRDTRCTREMGPAIGDAHDLMSTSEQSEPPRDKRRKPRGDREPAIVLAQDIAAAACSAMGLDHVPRPLKGQGGPGAIARVRRIVRDAALCLLPDETGLGVSRVLADALGGDADPWSKVKPCDDELREISDRIVAARTPILGKLDWSTGVRSEVCCGQPCRPIESMAPGGGSDDTAPRVAALDLPGAIDSSGGVG